MQIYEKIGKSIYIYDMRFDDSAVIKYRKHEMEQINDKEKVLKLETNNPPEYIKTVFKHFENKIINARLSDFNGGGEFPNSYRFITKSRNGEKALSDYYADKYNSCNVVKISDANLIKTRLGIIKYLLVNSGYRKESDGYFCLDKVISIPESLYMLELLKKGYFNLLKDEDICKLLHLLRVSYTFVGAYDYQDESSQFILEKINNSKKVLRLARKERMIK
ncbi:MAG: hypothetical protein E7165_02410 [Firmicutes bacterium]|nr:hypothetical protein [Bacillota bacterium]